MHSRMIALSVEAITTPVSSNETCSGIRCAATWELGQLSGQAWYSRISSGVFASRMSRIDVQHLVGYLASVTQEGATLVTFGGSHRGLRLLGVVGQRKRICRRLALAHIDIVIDNICRIGYRLRLERLEAALKSNPLVPRTTPAERRQLWADGCEDLVLEQVQQRARTVLNVAQEGQSQGCIRWISRSGVTKKQSLDKGWWTVLEALAAPPPRNSWMRNPPELEPLVDWLE